MSPRRGNGEGSVYQTKDGRWRGAVTLPSGKRKVVSGRTRAEAAVAMAFVLAAVKANRPLPDDQVTVGRFLTERWLPTVEGTRAPKTITSYRQTVRDHIVPHVGRTRLSRLSPQDVQAMMAAVEAASSAHLAKYARSVLRIGLTAAEKWGVVPRNVATLTDPPAVEEREITPLTPGQARLLLDSLEGDPMRTFYLLAMTTGLRLGELLGLHWEDVDLEAGVLQVRRQVQRRSGGGLAERRTKTRGSRAAVALTQMAVTALRAHRRETSRMAGSVFVTASGEPLDPSNVRRHLRRALAAVELPMIRPHDLRHSTATFLLAAGVPARVVQEVLRHASTRMLGTYQHVDVRMQREAMLRLDALLADPGGPGPEAVAIPVATQAHEPARTETHGN